MSSLISPTILCLSLSPPLLSSPPLRHIAMKPLYLLPASVDAVSHSIQPHLRSQRWILYGSVFGPRACISSSHAPFARRFPFIFSALSMFSFHISPSPYALPSSIDIYCAPRSPGLLVRFVFGFDVIVLPFRSLQVSGMYIAWLVDCL